MSLLKSKSQSLLALTKSKPIQTVAVAWKQFLGTWYEQARLPTWFETSLMGKAKATYSQNSDGSLRVVNTSRDVLGFAHTIEGRAVIDAKHKGTLIVQFDGFSSSSIRGLYCVLDVRKDMAVVGHPDRAHLWFLSREKNYTSEQRLRFLQVAKQNGYAVQKIVFPRWS